MKKKIEWRTPSATDGSNGGPNARDSAGGLHLSAQVHFERESNNWPTPRTKGMCGGTGNFNQMKKLEAEGVISEDERKGMTAGNGGKLNPAWVCLLMGWPQFWTVLDDEASRWFRSRADGKQPKGVRVEVGPLLADPWGPGWEDGVARTVVSVPFRVDQLRCTGNGVVPQASVPAWSLIAAIAMRRVVTDS